MFLYTWCTRRLCNRLGRTPICRDSMVNDMFRNTFPMRDYCIIQLSLGEQELGVRRQLWYVLFSHMCTRECCNRLGILWLIICFAIHFLCVLLHNTSNPRKPRVRCTTSALVCISCTRGVQDDDTIGIVVLQSAEILGLIICFAIYFLCVTIE